MGSGSNYQEFLDKRRVEQAIMQSNAARFRLTEDTPPLQDPLLSDLSYLGIMEASKQILVGTYVCPLEVDDFTRDFLSCLQISQNIPPVMESVPQSQRMTFRDTGGSTGMHLLLSFGAPFWTLQSGGKK